MTNEDENTLPIHPSPTSTLISAFLGHEPLIKRLNLSVNKAPEDLRLASSGNIDWSSKIKVDFI